MKKISFLIFALFLYVNLNSTNPFPKSKNHKKRTAIKKSVEQIDYTIPGKLVGSNPGGVVLCKGKTGVCVVIIELPTHFFRVSLNTEEGWVHYGANEFRTEEDGEFTIVKFR